MDMSAERVNAMAKVRIRLTLLKMSEFLFYTQVDPFIISLKYKRDKINCTVKAYYNRTFRKSAELLPKTVAIDSFSDYKGSALYNLFTIWIKYVFFMLLSTNCKVSGVTNVFNCEIESKIAMTKWDKTGLRGLSP